MDSDIGRLAWLDWLRRHEVYCLRCGATARLDPEDGVSDLKPGTNVPRATVRR